MRREAVSAARSVDVAETLAADVRLLLKAGRAQGAALLHAEAAMLLLAALRGPDADNGARDDGVAGPASLPRGDALASRFRAVWLDHAEAVTRVPGIAELRAMADGLRALVPAVRDRIAPVALPGPSSRKPAESPTRKPASTTPRKPAPSPQPGRPAPPPALRSAPKPASPPAPHPASPPAPLRPVSSAAFWSLIDRWGVGDADALALLGHAGGLTRRGTRPRFRLDRVETARFHLLQTLDDALGALGADPRAWLRAAVPAAPFSGAPPLATLLRAGGDAARGETILRDAARQVVGEGLRRSLR